DAVVAVDGDGGEGAVADPGDALGLVADLELVDGLARLEIDHGDGAVVGVDGEQAAAVGADVQEAVGGAGGGDGGGQGEEGGGAKAREHEQVLRGRPPRRLWRGHHLGG